MFKVLQVEALATSRGANKDLGVAVENAVNDFIGSDKLLVSASISGENLNSAWSGKALVAIIYEVKEKKAK